MLARALFDRLDHERQAVLLGQATAALRQRDRLPEPPLELCDGALHLEHPGRELGHAEPLRRGQRPVRHHPSQVVVPREHGGGREVPDDAQDVRVVGEVLVLAQRLLGHRTAWSRWRAEYRVSPCSAAALAAPDRSPIEVRSAELGRDLQRAVVLAGGPGVLDDPLHEVGPLGVLGGDVEGLHEERDRLADAAEGLGAIRGAAQGESRLGPERGRLGRVGRGLEGREVVGRERPGELVVAERLEEPSRGEMARLRSRSESVE